MFFKQLFDPASSTYTYLIADDTTHEAVIIDPVLEQLERDVNLLRGHGLSLKYSLETHVHADHVTGAHALQQATGAQTAVARDCSAPGYDRYLEDGNVILFGHEEILVIATPGHTPGSVSYLWRDRVFTGDALLIGGCGRTDFQNGSAAALYTSITEKLFKLDEQVLVYPGHDYKGRRVSSIGEEKQFNARLAGKTLEEFVEIMDNLNLPTPKRIHEAVPMNLAGGRRASDADADSSVQVTSPRPAVPLRSVSPIQLSQAAGLGSLRILDVRTEGEFAALRIGNSFNVPLDRLDPVSMKATIDPTSEIYCVCQTGTRSQLAAELLRRAGFERVVHVDGGTNAWVAAGLPVERLTRNVVSMERQVRIAAGALILLGVLIGALVHPAGYAFAGLVGVGLIFAGLSNFCGMSLLLAKMPWNRARWKPSDTARVRQAARPKVT
jgi:glyoxylase-like metal-dependent hydrolase (beta-lactamase superfamily II)/rhodanese-related sulfurtransferase